jgi:hypothetical protein
MRSGAYLVSSGAGGRGAAGGDDGAFPSWALRKVTMPAEERNITHTATMRMSLLLIPYYSAAGC